MSCIDGQSFLDPPLVIAGRGTFNENEEKYKWILPERVTYHLRQNQFKTVCVEMETDDSVGSAGLDFDVEVRYDDCQWTEYTECYIPDESDQHWDRGPFYGLYMHIDLKLLYIFYTAYCIQMDGAGLVGTFSAICSLMAFLSKTYISDCAISRCSTKKANE